MTQNIPKKKRVFLSVETTAEVLSQIDALIKKLNSDGGSYNRSDIVRLSISNYLKKNS